MVSSFDKYDLELVNFRRLVNRKREHYPELSLEQCVQLAVADWFDPEGESDPRFREYLKAREIHLEGVRDGGDEDSRQQTVHPPREQD